MPGYILFRGLTLLLYLIPFKLLYVFSDFAFFILFYVLKYRKQVVIENIANSFKMLNETERNSLVKKFFRNLSDILIEGLKGFTMSEKEIKKRYHLKNPELLDAYFKQGHDVICLGSHYANWEWGIMAAPDQIKHQLVAIYTPLSNRLINEYMMKNRSRFGSIMVPKSEAKSVFTLESDRPKAYLFGGDQSPERLRNIHWMELLGQDTAVMKGAEFFAKQSSSPVIYFDVQRVARGFYTVEVSTLFENPCATEEGEITEKYMRTLEEIIYRKPEDYLWSHRRWKHKKQTELV